MRRPVIRSWKWSRSIMRYASLFTISEMILLKPFLTSGWLLLVICLPLFIFGNLQYVCCYGVKTSLFSWFFFPQFYAVFESSCSKWAFEWRGSKGLYFVPTLIIRFEFHTYICTLNSLNHVARVLRMYLTI